MVSVLLFIFIAQSFCSWSVQNTRETQQQTTNKQTTKLSHLDVTTNNTRIICVGLFRINFAPFISLINKPYFSLSFLVYLYRSHTRLKPDGILVPRELSIFMSPLTDGATHAYLKTQADFWDDTNFFGIDYSCMKDAAYLEHFSQPMAGQIDNDAILCNTPNKWDVDLTVVTPKTLDDMTMPFLFRCDKRGIAHGFGFWFELSLGLRAANGEAVIRSGPSTTEAQWYTCRMIMPKKLSVTPSTTVVGQVTMTKNPMKSYDFKVRARIEGSNSSSSVASLSSTHTFSLNNHSCSAMGTLGDEDAWTNAIPTSTTATWFIGVDGEQQGPFSEEQIEKLINGGSTVASTFVWRDGMIDWVEIGKVDKFKSYFGNGPPSL